MIEIPRGILPACIYCSKCRVMVREPHKCPVWLFRYDDMLPRQWDEHRGGSDAEEVARLIGEEYDQGGDYTLAKGRTVDIYVRRPDQAPAEALGFTVSGEAVMQYHAEPKEISANKPHISPRTAPTGQATA